MARGTNTPTATRAAILARLEGPVTVEIPFPVGLRRIAEGFKQRRERLANERLVQTAADVVCYLAECAWRVP